MKILINCYACSPYKGSEPGMGWNFVRCLSKKHELHIITESKFQPDLEKYFSEHPEERKAYHFYFIRKERHKKLRKIWPPSYYWFYSKWQREAYKLAKELDQKENFDLIHQLNMIGYREPGYLWKMNKPFVWGPIGGFNITPWQLLPSMGLYGFIFFFLRNLINLWQMHTNSRVKNAICKADAVICATQEDKERIFKLWGVHSLLISEVGLTDRLAFQNSVMERLPNNLLKVCWSGLHIPRKSLNLLIESLAVCSNRDNIELHVLGSGTCTNKWKNLSRKLRLSNIRWYGSIDRNNAMEVMGNCHVFTQTSLSDATSTVLLEALSMGIPVIALNHLGFANVLTNDCGIKINVTTKKKVVNDIAHALDWLYEHEEKRREMSIGAFERAKAFSWERKAEMIDEIYKKIVNQ